MLRTFGSYSSETFGGPLSCAMLIQVPKRSTGARPTSLPFHPTFSPHASAVTKKGRVACHPAQAFQPLSRQRIGGAYCRPPLVHSALMPRAILSGEPCPTFFSRSEEHTSE